MVTDKGIATSPDKVEAVKSWKTPKSKKDVKSFLGLSGYYRRFIPNYSSIAKPLHNITAQSSEFLWNDGCQKSFVQLKESLISAPVLSYPKAHGLFILDCDASGYGLGSVLSQVQDNEEKVIAYASKTLTPEEINYCYPS